jgi:serine protease inhibitor
MTGAPFPNGFAFALAQTIFQAESGVNSFFSPFSIAAALTIDRPFFTAIRHVPSGVILFMGAVYAPSSER